MPLKPAYNALAASSAKNIFYPPKTVDFTGVLSVFSFRKFLSTAICTILFILINQIAGAQIINISTDNFKAEFVIMGTDINEILLISVGLLLLNIVYYFLAIKKTLRIKNHGVQTEGTVVNIERKPHSQNRASYIIRVSYTTNEGNLREGKYSDISLAQKLKIGDEVPIKYLKEEESDIVIMKNFSMLKKYALFIMVNVIAIGCMILYFTKKGSISF